ncbi:uncharacterized protein LOC113497542 [Trichoplusia ni]|uniref:Uncharacterized protein LOC113497542 n=1 Tax=Trichoplusia ni TaxID=7111 RepID=A0A7E5VX74_TRINI|nr:uncharacterized protein LOC113497542 [Trichoplusia ni]
MRECRICRDTECSNMVIIDESNGFLNLYNYCFGLAVTTQDVPRYLCKECAEKVTKFSCFKEECLKSEQLWKSEKTDPKTIYKNIKTEIDAENEESRDSYVSNGASFEISSYFNENNDEDSKPPHMEDPMKFTTDFIEEKGSNSDIEDDTANKKTDEKSNDKGKGRIIKQFKCRKCKKVYGMYLKVFFLRRLTGATIVAGCHTTLGIVLSLFHMDSSSTSTDIPMCLCICLHCTMVN